MKYTSDSFWFSVEIVNPNVGTELPSSFAQYDYISRLLLLGRGDTPQFMDYFRNYQSYANGNNVDPPFILKASHSAMASSVRVSAHNTSFTRLYRQCGKALSMLRLINRERHAAISDMNLVNCSCIYYNKVPCTL